MHAHPTLIVAAGLGLYALVLTAPLWEPVVRLWRRKRRKAKSNRSAPVFWTGDE